MNGSESDVPPRKKTRIVWILAVVTIVIFSLMFYAYYRTSLQEVPSIKVIIDIEGTLDEPVISTIEFSQEIVPKTEKPRETNPHLPGIYIIAYGSKVDEGYFQPYTAWTSEDFYGQGIYTLTAGFNFEPKTGESLKIQVKIVDNSGSSIAVSEFFITWDHNPVIETEFRVTEKNETLEISEFNISKKWIPRESMKNEERELYPGIFLIVKQKDTQINYINSIDYTGGNSYSLIGYFKHNPKIGEILKIKLYIKDSKGNILAQFPENDDFWNYIWY